MTTSGKDLHVIQVRAELVVLVTDLGVPSVRLTVNQLEVADYDSLNGVSPSFLGAIGLSSRVCSIEYHLACLCEGGRVSGCKRHRDSRGSRRGELSIVEMEKLPGKSQGAVPM
jgi:hypothetical protein